MVRYLVPSSSIDVILDKIDSLHGLVSTFDVIMQGFYRESQGSGETIAHYIASLDCKLDEIHVKHLNRVSEAEAAGYIRDHLFYGLRKPIIEAIHAKFDTPSMITWFDAST